MRVPEFTPVFEQDEIRAVLETFEDNWLTEGKKTRELEEKLAEFFGCRRVLMMPNGTLALFAALKVLGIGPGDEVIVPDFTFFATASSVILTGAKPVLVDVDEFDFNISVNSAERSLSERTRAILPVHMYGQSCDLAAVTALARRYNLKVVEDAAQGMGVTFGRKHVGTFGDIGCLSFFADKTMTTGEGGALLVNDDALALECQYFKNQGRLHRGTFVHDRVGYNFRVTDLQAAVGVAQLRRVRGTIEKKIAMRSMYEKRLAGVPGVVFPRENGFGQAVPFRVNILVRDPHGLQDFLKERGIGSRRFFYPLHLQPSLNSTNCVVRETPVVSRRLFDRGLALPTSVNLTPEDIEFVCQTVEEFQASTCASDAVETVLSGAGPHREGTTRVAISS